MTGRQMIAVGVRRVILARGELDRLEGPGYAARRAELRREARARDRQAGGSGVVAERGRGERSDRGRSDKRENDESGKTARWHEGCSENRRGTAKRDRKRQTPKRQGWATASTTTLLSLKSLCGGSVPSSHPSLASLLSFFLSLLYLFISGRAAEARSRRAGLV